MDADDTRALIASLAMSALGIALLALAAWLFAQELRDHQPQPVPRPAPTAGGASWPKGAPAWAHTCDGTPQERDCPLP